MSDVLHNKTDIRQYSTLFIITLLLTLSYNSTYQYFAYNIFNPKFSSHLLLEINAKKCLAVMSCTSELQHCWDETFLVSTGSNSQLNTLRMGLLNCLSARSQGLNFRHRASCI